MKEYKVCRYLFGSPSNRCIGDVCAHYLDGECIDVIIAKSLREIAKMPSGKKVLVESARVVTQKDKKENNEENGKE